MQRRAAAAYAVLFLVVAAGAYATIGVAQEPAITLANPDVTASAGETVTIAGRTYTVGEIQGAPNEGDRLRSTELTWTNESARFTETWKNGSTVTRDGAEFTVITRPNATPSAVSLREVRSLGENVTTTEINGTTYVVVEEGGERTLVPRGEYLRERFGPPETREFAVGDSLQYENRTATLGSVTEEAATLTWTGEKENTVPVEEGANVTLNGQQFVAHFPDNSTLQLSRNLAAYRDEVRVQQRFQERMNGLWGVTLLSGLSAVLLLGMAYLPSRY